MDTKLILTKLNQMLKMEHGCIIRYKTYGVTTKGLYAEVIEKLFDHIAEEEEEHAGMLRQRIDALGGNPTTEVVSAEVKYGAPLQDVLDQNIQWEKEAISGYKDLFSSITKENIILYEAIEHILEDEEEHLEELQRLKG